MKKQYSRPETDIVLMDTNQMLAASTLDVDIAEGDFTGAFNAPALHPQDDFNE